VLTFKEVNWFTSATVMVPPVEPDELELAAVEPVLSDVELPDEVHAESASAPAVATANAAPIRLVFNVPPED
jgi:hypothetical protein